MLRDGGTARIRPITIDDADRLVSFYEQVSDESKYYRFFAPYPRLSAKDVHRFTHHDFVDRVGLAATIGGEFIATVRYDRIGADGMPASRPRRRGRGRLPRPGRPPGARRRLRPPRTHRGRRPRAGHPALRRGGTARQQQDDQGVHGRRLHPEAQLRGRRRPPGVRPGAHRPLARRAVRARAARRGALRAAAARPRLRRGHRRRPHARRRGPQRPRQHQGRRIHRPPVRREQGPARGAEGARRSSRVPLGAGHRRPRRPRGRRRTRGARPRSRHRLRRARRAGTGRALRRLRRERPRGTRAPARTRPARARVRHADHRAERLRDHQHLPGRPAERLARARDAPPAAGSACSPSPAPSASPCSPGCTGAAAASRASPVSPPSSPPATARTCPATTSFSTGTTTPTPTSR